jgi:cytochrome P450
MDVVGGAPTSPAVREREMYAWYASMRQAAPVHFELAQQCWHVFRYDDVQRALTEWETFSSDFASQMGSGEQRDALSSSIISQDPPRHRSLRSLVSKVFTPRAVADLAPRIQQIADELLAPVIPTGQLDVTQDFGFPLPVTVIAELLGIPIEDRDRFQRWSNAIVGSSEQVQGYSPAQRELGQYFYQIIEERRSAPRNDLISALIQAEVDGQRLSLTELLGFCILLLVAGNETTTNLIGNAVRCFAEDPATWRRLRENPALLPGAIEEVLRFLSPVQMLPTRFAKVDTQLGGQELRAGQQVILWLGSANRDEAKFPDAASFLLDRSPNQHLAFGLGIHFCLGAPLARLEAQIALGALLAGCPNLEIDETGAELVSGSIVYGYKRLPVHFTV